MHFAQAYAFVGAFLFFVALAHDLTAIWSRSEAAEARYGSAASRVAHSFVAAYVALALGLLWPLTAPLYAWRMWVVENRAAAAFVPFRFKRAPTDQ